MTAIQLAAPWALRIMLVLVLLCALPLLSGCASSPVNAIPTPVKETTVTDARIVGTLALLNSFEFELAPSLTKLATQRNRALILARRGALTRAEVQTVQDNADRARTELTYALQFEAKHKDVGAARAIAARALPYLRANDNILNK